MPLKRQSLEYCHGFFGASNTYRFDNEKWQSQFFRNDSIIRTVFYFDDYEEIAENGCTYSQYFLDNNVIIIKRNGSFEFYQGFTVHLGNIRSVVTKNPMTNEIAEMQQTHYYPFGGIIADISSGRSVQNKLYNAKELDTSNNLWWYDYGARQYDPTRGQFTNYDQHCESYYSTNPLAYCHNRPNIFIDPNGMDDHYANNGNFLFRDDKDTDNIMIGGGTVTFEFPDATFDITIEGTPIENTELTADAYSNIFSDILSKMDGVDIKDLEGGRVQTTVWNNLENGVKTTTSYTSKAHFSGGSNATTTRSCSNITVYINLIEDNRYLFSTVSNVQNMIGWHEYGLHLKKRMNDGVRLQQKLREHSSWKKTTPQYKQHTYNN